jgi:hypothetical protein
MGPLATSAQLRDGHFKDFGLCAHKPGQVVGIGAHHSWRGRRLFGVMVAAITLARPYVRLGIVVGIVGEGAAFFDRRLDPALVVAPDVALVAVGGDVFLRAPRCAF